MARTVEGTCPALPIDNGCRVVIEVRDPTTGAEVSGVQVSNVNIYGLDLSAGDGTAELAGPFLYVPGPEADSVAA